MYLVAVSAASVFAAEFWMSARMQNATTWAAQDAHEGLTVTAEPWTDPSLYKRQFKKRNPLTAGIAAIRVTFQNDSADTLRVNLERIQLQVTISEDSRQNLPALSPEEVADRTLSAATRDPTARRVPLPLPIPIGRSKANRTKEWTELEKAARDAEVSSSIVPPHGKVQGLLYFDVASQLDLLSTGHLYIPEIISLERNKSLFYFDIDLAKKASR